MANSLNDGLSEPQSLGSPATVFLSGNSYQKNLAEGAIDYGTFTGSGNTTVVEFTSTFTSVPQLFCFPTVGSVSAANTTVLSNIGTGSFSAAAGSNIAQAWFAAGPGNFNP